MTKKTSSNRLSAKTVFALELLCRQNKRSKTSMIEELIFDAAKKLNLGVDWESIFTTDEGLLMLNLFRLPHVRLSDDEERVKQFVVAHKEYFYTKNNYPAGVMASVLWKRIEDYRMHWLQNMHEDPWCAGKMMDADLKKAKLSPPDLK